MNQPTNQPAFPNSPSNSTTARPSSQSRIQSVPSQGLPTRQELSQQAPTEEAHLTKTGLPDRRFKGQRDLPDPPINPNYHKPAKSLELDSEGHLLTKDGKPDRRFKGARELSDEEVKIAQAKFILEKAGVRK